MAIVGTSSELRTLNSPEIEMAWHLLTTLIRLGCPARPSDLALRSTLAPDLVVLLCSVPGSPLILTDDGFVCPSEVVSAAFWRFVAKAIDWSTPSNRFGAPGLRRRWSKVRLVYSRKRKACNIVTAYELALSSKKRAILSGIGEYKSGELQKLPSQLNATPRKIYFDLASHSIGVNALGCRSVVSDQAYVVPIDLQDFSDFDLKVTSHIRVEYASKNIPKRSHFKVPYMKANDYSCYECVALDVGVNASIPEAHVIQKLKIAEPYFSSSLPGSRDQSLLLNHFIEVACSSLFLEWRINASNQDALECLNIIGFEFGESPMGGVLNLSKLHHGAHKDQTDFLLASRNEAIDVSNLHPKDEIFFDTQLSESQKVLLASTNCPSTNSSKASCVGHEIAKNIVPIDARRIPTRMVEPANISKQKQWNFGVLNETKTDIPSRKQKARSVEISFIAKKKAKIIQDESMPSKDKMDSSKISIGFSVKKLMPNVDLFVIKEGCSDAGQSTKGGELQRFPSHLTKSPMKICFDVARHSFNINILGYHSIVSDQAYTIPVCFQGFSDCELNIFSNIAAEDISKSTPDHFCSMVSNMEAKDFSCYGSVALDVGVRGCIPEEQIIEKSSIAEPYFSLSLPGALNQPLLLDYSMEEDNLFLQLGVHGSNPEFDVHGSLNIEGHEFGESHFDRNLDQSMLHQGASKSQMEFLLTPTNEYIDVSNMHPKDHKFLCSQLLEPKKILLASTNCQNVNASRGSCAVTEDANNTIPIDARLRLVGMVEPANASKQKHRSFIELNTAKSRIPSGKKNSCSVEASLFAKQKAKIVQNEDTPSKEDRLDASKTYMCSSVKKLMPNFELFVIKEEEGSGGYGTVYKAQRKEDGKIFAIKCPHANAHPLHVNNELKMLERFGGRNFVIKYEGSFKNGDSECFILEHIQHDRPEVLKKEINLVELQRYGYCLFKALESLHKQGVVHRDVKPGNFLFSRKLNKGFLIDFNLASDLHQKFCRSSKQKISNICSNSNPPHVLKTMSTIESRKVMSSGLLENAMKEASNYSNSLVMSKSAGKKPNQVHRNGLPISHGSQTADVSGVTSAKDQTSAKTPMDWLKQPLPSKGRKELISFLHQAMHRPQNYKPVPNVSSQRKRVRAPMGKNDARLIILTPMPLFSGVNAVAGAGMLKNKANGKHRREGPCVGTKGFRAPEVLFKSFHQGCKIDVWSAGVTLLYLMIGRAPFGGDPEVNIKEIAKLRGSEVLWEVAKLHNCETSFPVELLDVDFLKSMDLRDWCAKNTKRPEFLELIPESLWDLIDRCLVVNPRCRLSAEDALMHKFFASCHGSNKKAEAAK